MIFFLVWDVNKNEQRLQAVTSFCLQVLLQQDAASNTIWVINMSNAVPKVKVSRREPSYLDLLTGQHSYTVVHRQNPHLGRKAMTEFHFLKRSRLLHVLTPFIELSVAATSPQRWQARRKLEIRSSSHKSLQSPKGTQNTSEWFPLITDQQWRHLRNQPDIQISNPESHTTSRPDAAPNGWKSWQTGWCVQADRTITARMHNGRLLIDNLQAPRWQETHH